MNNFCLDLKKKVELETNELRDKMQFDKKVGNLKMKEKNKISEIFLNNFKIQIKMI